MEGDSVVASALTTGGKERDAGGHMAAISSHEPRNACHLRNRGTSLVRKRTLLGPYRRLTPRVIWPRSRATSPGTLATCDTRLALQGNLTYREMVIYCQTTSVSAAHATHGATYCTPLLNTLQGYFTYTKTQPSRTLR